MTIADKIVFFCWTLEILLSVLCDSFTYDEKLAYVLLTTVFALVYFVEVLVKERR